MRDPLINGWKIPSANDNESSEHRLGGMAPEDVNHIVMEVGLAWRNSDKSPLAICRIATDQKLDASVFNRDTARDCNRVISRTSHHGNNMSHKLIEESLTHYTPVDSIDFMMMRFGSTEFRVIYLSCPEHPDFAGMVFF